MLLENRSFEKGGIFYSIEDCVCGGYWKLGGPLFSGKRDYFEIGSGLVKRSALETVGGSSRLGVGGARFYSGAGGALARFPNTPLFS